MKYDMDTNLKRAISKAYKSSPRGELDAAIALVSKWRKKETIARNKLARAIENLAKLSAEHIKRMEELEAKHEAHSNAG